MSDKRVLLPSAREANGNKRTEISEKKTRTQFSMSTTMSKGGESSGTDESAQTSHDQDKNVLKTLTYHKWYHGMMPRDDIEELLQKDGDFLVRKTEVKGNTRFAISVFNAKRVRHILINRKPKGDWFIRQAIICPSIIELIQAHIDKKEPLQPDGTIISSGVPRPDYYILHENVEVRERLGGGNFGDVHRGLLKLDNGRTIDVALKKLKGTSGKKGRSEFVKEAKLARRFHHSNIVQMVGVAPQEEPMLILLELCRGGALQSSLKKRGDITTNEELLKYTTDACRGMCYLASRKVIHRDLAARNCLLSENDEVKISDFGLASTETVIKVDKLRNVPVRWLSPETLKRGEFTTKTDVWSFGVMTWEISMRCKVEPFPQMTNTQARQKIQSGATPMEPPEGTPTKLVQIMNLCFVQEPEQRPNFEALLMFLSPTEKLPVPED